MGHKIPQSWVINSNIQSKHCKRTETSSVYDKKMEEGNRSYIIRLTKMGKTCLQIHSLFYIFPPCSRKGRDFGTGWKTGLIMYVNTNQKALIVWIAKRIVWLQGKELMALIDYWCLHGQGKQRRGRGGGRNLYFIQISAQMIPQRDFPWLFYLKVSSYFSL